MPQQHLYLRMLCLAGTACFILAPVPESLASGIYITQVGGPDSGPTEANPAAVFWNPATLGPLRDPSLLLDSSYFWRTSAYEKSHRMEFDEATEKSFPVKSDSTERAELSNVFPFPFIGFTYPLSKGVLGIGAYAPFGASSEWDDSNGAQKYFADESTFAHYFITPAYAHPITENTYVGFGLSYVRAFLDTRRLIDFAVELTGGQQELQENKARSHLDSLAGNAFNGTLGIFGDYGTWRFGISFATPTRIRIRGIQSLAPIGSFLCNKVACKDESGTPILEPTPENNGQIQPHLASVDGSYTLPASIKSSIDYFVTPRLRTRLYGEWVDWSSFETIELRPSKARLNLFADKSSPEHFQDAFGLRLGGKYWLTDRWAPFAGVGYDSNAIPDEWLTPAIFDSDKFSGTVGVDLAVTDRMNFKMAFVQVIYADRTIELKKSSQEPPAPGRYENSVSIVNAGFLYRFARPEREKVWPEP